MEFNGLKSVIVSFTLKHSPLNGQYEIGGKKIPRSDSMKYLGIVLDSKLAFDEQVDRVMSKCRKRIGAIRMLFGRKHREAKIRLFKAIVQPVLSYCAAVWIPWQKTALDRLDNIRKEFSV